MAYDLSFTEDGLIEFFRSALVGLVRLGRRDLSPRQLAAFLICYYKSEPQTVRALAARLEVSRPAISKLLDVLETCDLLRRERDPRDRRSVVLRHTQTGYAFDQTLKDILMQTGPFSPMRFEAPVSRINSPAH